MTEEKSENQTENINKANIGDMIQISRGNEQGQKGKVLVTRENSVIAEIGRDVKKDVPIKTVVNHKNYKLIKS
ncbi:DUF2187 family protein [Bacillus sp. V33-4]|uniref:DUF2187 family protein n=1 Tax=Bacillus sp. V33-4 TaxID=2054169 RepID=UPI000C7862C4|nr:DUF2187 family protein [Bacillus sp. V33-4]PLR87710.1 DUF2187 domain-containing protein [Bacillus sp. V33-4]